MKKELMNKTLFVFLMTLMLLSFGLQQAVAGPFPSRPITLIVPFPPGGNADINLRVLAEAAEKELGQQVVVTPMPGAGAQIGMKKALSSRPDGYTIFLAVKSIMSISTQVRNLGYTWETPEYICTVCAPNYYLGISRSLKKFQNFDGFIKYAKKHPGELNLGQIGLTGLHNYTSLLLKKQFNIDFQCVPFNGGPPTISALLGGHVDLIWTDNYNSGVKAIVLPGKPSKYYPGVPTFSDLGFANLSTGIYYTLAAPKGTPPDVLKTLESAFKKAVDYPKYAAILDSLKWGKVWMSGAETRKSIELEAAEVKKMIDSGAFKIKK